MSQRLAAIQSLVEQDPSNSRLRYMLAMETLNLGDLDGAVRVFEDIVTRDPDYPAAYYHAGQALEKLARTDDARAMYRRGIEATTRNGDAHTRSELEAALAILV